VNKKFWAGNASECPPRGQGLKYFMIAWNNFR